MRDTLVQQHTMDHLRIPSWMGGSCLRIGWIDNVRADRASAVLSNNGKGKWQWHRICLGLCQTLLL